MAAPPDKPVWKHMTAEQWQEIKPQLHRVLMLESDLRSEQLEELVRRYPALRGELEGLAASFHDISNDFLAPESAWWSSQLLQDSPAPSQIGVRLGPYEIIGQIGAGGMGEVFRARRADFAYEKLVAIKVVRVGQDSAFVLSRFKQERQILAGLDHSNIARLLDGGTSAQGLPYFVMELIEGSRITDYCEKRSLGIEERLTLFIPVCRAVEYAHQRGIIHRDIKPGNILVTGEGIPKLLDFGIAKFLDPGSNVSDSTSTMSMFRPLTPAYASPEQMRGGPITKSTDIYSLGVVLYELLCGHGPYANVDGAPDNLARAMSDSDPPPPSAAKPVAATPDNGEAVHAEQSTPERLKRLRGDLDTIVMTALRKEQARRYGSAEEFARDIELHLECRPIRARKDSLAYRAAKFGRRNPALTVTGLVVLIAVAASIATRMSQPRSPIAPPQPSVRLRPSAAVLGFRSVSSDATTSWISGALSEVLNRAMAAGGQLRTVSRELVAKSKIDLGISEAEVLDHAQSNRVRSALDTDYIILGSYSVANGKIRLDIRAQDTRTGETIASVSDTGSSLALVDLALREGAHLRQRLGIADLTEAETHSLAASFPAVSETLRDYSLGIESLNKLDAEGARTALHRSLEREPEHALSHEALSTAWSMLGYEPRAADEAKRAADLSGPLARPDQLAIEARYDETTHQKAKALEVYKTLFRLYPDDIEYGLQLAETETENGKGSDALETLKILRNLPDPVGKDPRIDLIEANAATSLGDYQLGMSAAAQAVQKAEADGSRSIVALAYLRQGVAFRHIKDLSRAKQSFQSSIALYQAIGNLRGAASGWNGLGNTLEQQGDLGGSRHAYEQAIAFYLQVGDNSEMAAIIGNLANVVGDQGDLDGSMKLYRQELGIAREIDDRLMIAETLNNVGVVKVLQGQLREGANDFQQSIAILRDLGDIDSVAQALDSLGGVQLLRGDVGQAIATFNEELADFRKAGDGQATAYALGSLGQALAMSGDLKNAEQNLNQALTMTRESGEKHFIAQNLVSLGRVHVFEAKTQEARKEFDEALSIQDQMGEKYTQEETRLNMAELEIADSHYDQAASLARRALNEAHNEHMRDEQLYAHSMLARILSRQHRVREARAELSDAQRLGSASENLPAKLRLIIASADVAQPSLGAQLRRELQAAAADADNHALFPFKYEATLLLGLGEASSKTSHGCIRLDALRTEASVRGFRRIAEAATSACR
jgi:serine/threonine protein kinase/tetratricopeptide (TPR) repeat protein